VNSNGLIQPKTTVPRPSGLMRQAGEKRSSQPSPRNKAGRVGPAVWRVVCSYGMVIAHRVAVAVQARGFTGGSWATGSAARARGAKKEGVEQG
jgi:hypothetical protein